MNMKRNMRRIRAIRINNSRIIEQLERQVRYLDTELCYAKKEIMLNKDRYVERVKSLRLEIRRLHELLTVYQDFANEVAKLPYIPLASTLVLKKKAKNVLSYLPTIK